MGIDRSRIARAFLAKPPLAIDKGSHAASYHEEHLLAALLQDVPVLLVSRKDVLCLQARAARRAVGKDNIIVHTTKFTGNLAKARNPRRLILANSLMMRSNSGSRHMARKCWYPKTRSGHMNMVL